MRRSAVSLLMYVRVYLFYPGLRWFCRRFIGCIALSMGCFALSLFVEEPYRYVLWLLGVGIQAAASPTIYLSRHRYPVQLSHMPERFGLFNIIVLGEGIVALTAASQAETFQWETKLEVLEGVALTVCVWKLYFYEASKDTITEQQKRTDRLSTVLSFLYGYGHYFLYASLMLLSVSVLFVIESTVEGHHHPTFAVQLLHLSCIAFLGSITLIHWAAPESLYPRVIGARAIAVGISGVLLLLDLAALTEMYTQVAVLSSLILAEYLIYRDRGAVPTLEENEIIERPAGSD